MGTYTEAQVNRHVAAYIDEKIAAIPAPGGTSDYYTPTVGWAESSSNVRGHYHQIDNIVKVDIGLDISSIVGISDGAFNVSIPVPSTLALASDATGVVTIKQQGGTEVGVGVVYADTVNNDLIVEWAMNNAIVGAATAHMAISASYRINP